jgi:hypothetical protein
MAQNKVARAQSRSKVEGKAAKDERAVPITKSASHRILSEAIDSLVAEVDSIAGVAKSLHYNGALTTDSDPLALREAAGVVRSHALGMLLSVVQIVAKSERIQTIADVNTIGGAA